MSDISRMSLFGPSFARTINDLVNELASKSAIQNDIDCYKTETDTSVSFMFDLPGVQKEDIKIDFVDNGTALTVGAVRKIDDTELKMNAKVAVPKKADTAGDVKCSLKDGVLTVAIPTKKETQPRKLTIE